ncbi:FimV/HubP family polar landmark protein [Acinetobacter sp.]|uniref:FimV/HubP family polar landmark protein n=1 Tax=Acinetobacter sp. TaxID=472 RepID=UPI0028A5BB72|nr:FimV/HubP family polar landmark protein [Acinetobacter sp.]
MTELTIKMTVYNKLKLAILAIVASQNIYAINVDPVQIQSAPGELLYAEMTFRQSDINLPIEVSLASPEDLLSIGASHQPPGHLNFFTRRSNNGTGVITITSSRPMTERELNIIVKIKEGNAARLQHIRTPLQAKTDLLKASLKQNERPLAPVVVVSEKDIALNLPVSSHYNTAASTALNKPPALEKPLALQRTAPPTLSNTSIPKTAFAPAVMASTPAIQAQAITPVLKSEAVTAPDTPAPVKTAPVLSDSVKTSQATLASPAPAAASTTNKPTSTIPANQSASAPNKANMQKAVESHSDHQTASSDPLVKKFAEEQARKSTGSANPVKTPAPVTTKASPVKATPNQTQPTYVVQSNESLWGIASRIAQQQQRPVNQVMQQIKKDNEHAFIGGNANRLRKGAALNLNTTHPTPAPIKVTAAKQTKLPSKPTGKTKYRLNQAEMSLVAENQRDSGQVSANQNTERNQTSKELSLKVMTAREKTVKLQRNVTELELALNQKDHRIQLLNARLAQLQQQLKAQQADKKPIN